MNADKLAADLECRRYSALMDHSANGRDLHGTTEALIGKLKVTCPSCSQELGATRFALHYERCLNRGTRARSASVSAGMSSSSNSPAPATTSSTTTPAWTVPCGTCKSVNDVEKMALCDGCSRCYHLYCLAPKLDEIPAGYWFCRRCVLRVVGGGSSSSSLVADHSGLLTHTKRIKGSKMGASEKVNKMGRVAVDEEVVEFLCDLCGLVILPDASRFRCLQCGEFDVCQKCRHKGGQGHRSTHEMVEFRIT